MSRPPKYGEELSRCLLVIEEDALREWKAYLELRPDQSFPIGRSGSRVVLVNHSSE